MIIGSVLLTTALDDSSIPQGGRGRCYLAIAYTSYYVPIISKLQHAPLRGQPLAFEFLKTDLFKFKYPTIMLDLNFKFPSTEEMCRL